MKFLKVFGAYFVGTYAFIGLCYTINRFNNVARVTMERKLYEK